MIYLPEVSGLRLIDVFDRGEANKECVAVRAEDALVEMGNYGLMLGWQQSPGVAVPIKDFFFYFGAGTIQKGDWVFVYTGSGEPWQRPGSDGKGTIYGVHWGRPTTLFANTNIVPVLFHIGSVTVGQSPQNQPQLGLLGQNKLLGR